MTLIIDCPSCQRKLRVPDELLGTQVKCPTCAVTFVASETLTPAAAPPAESPKEEPASQPPTEPAGEGPPPLPSEAVTATPKNCPSCGVAIIEGSTRCRACGEPLDREPISAEDEKPWERSDRGPTRRDSEPHRGTLILTFGILSLVMFFIAPLGLCLGMAAWIMGQSDLKKIRNNIMDPRGKELTQSGWICGIIGTVINGIISLCCVGMIGLMVADANRTAQPKKAPAPPRKFQTPLPVRWSPISAPRAVGN